MTAAKVPETTYPTVLMGQVVLAVVALLGIRLFGRPVDIWGPSVTASLLLGLAGGVVTYLALFGFSRSRFYSFLEIEALMKKIYPIFSGYSWPQIISISLLAGFGEELLFRVLVQGWLSEAFNAHIGLAVASLLFGLAHFLSVVYLVVTAGMGLILGLTYQLTGSAALVIVWHALYDIIAIGVLVKAPHLLGIQVARPSHGRSPD